MKTSEFLDKLNAGSDSALEDLFQRYFEKLRSLAARRMGAHVRAEPESVVMSVMGSMVRGFREGRYHVSNSRRLWNLLVTITLNKIRKLAANRHGDVSLPSDLHDQLSQSPGPDDLALIEELIETALKGLDSEYRQILTLYLAGHNRTEIADQLHMSYSATKYRVNRITDRLVKLLDQAERK